MNFSTLVQTDFIQNLFS